MVIDANYCIFASINEFKMGHNLLVMNNRLEYIDILRGFAIITVVMGHIIQYNIHGVAASVCFDFIYSFHMGFFFFISGCTASLSAERNVWRNFYNFLYKKSCQLLVPFIVWGLLVYSIVNTSCYSDIPSRFVDIFKQPDNQSPWFLLYLYCIQIVFFACCALSQKIRFKHARIFVLLASIPFVFVIMYLKNNYVTQFFVWISPDYLLMFVMGVFVQTYLYKACRSKYVIFLCFIGFVYFAPKYDFYHYSYQMRIIKIIASISFSVAVYFITKSAYSELGEKTRKYIRILGTNTLEIYVSHYYFIQFYPQPWIEVGLMNVIPLFVIVLSTSLPFCLLIVKVANILKQVPGMSLVLFGKYR